ncbi:SAM-dependent methyltransferase [Streptomyces sp. NPDC004838]
MPQNPNDPWPPAPLPPVTSARLYNACQGGKDAYESDHDTAARITALGLDPQLIAAQNRRFHNRTVRHCTRELGISQVLDIGCGLPAQTGPDTHDIVENAHPDTSRVLYIDHDPVVVAHARALLRGNRPDATTATRADLRHPDQILRTARDHLDLTRPVLLLLTAVLDCLPHEDGPHGLVRTLVSALPPGSAIVISHVTDDFAPETMRRAEALLADQALQTRTRPYDDITSFFDGLTLVEPGLVPVHQWHQPDPDMTTIPADRIHTYGGIGLTP